MIVAVNVTDDCSETGAETIWNDPVDCPAGIVTDPGPFNVLELLVTVTTTPPDPAGPFRVRVAVEIFPPITVAGDNVIESNASGLTVNVVVLEVAPNVAVKVTVEAAWTAEVLTTNVAELPPAGTVTELGTVAEERLEESEITVPPVGAGPVRLTVPIALKPPTTAVGFTLTPVRAEGLIVSPAVRLILPVVAFIEAVVAEPTGRVDTVKEAVVAPAATVTVAGTLALVVLDARVTASPPTGAWPFKVTVPVEGVPPITEVGLSVNPVMVGGTMVSVAETVVPPSVADSDALVVLATGEVVIVKVLDVAPAATVTVAGTTALELSDERLTVSPPIGAGPLNVTVPVEEVPPTTETGATVKPLGTGGVMLRTEFTVTPLAVAEMVAFVTTATAEVPIGNVAVVCPAETVTCVGGVALPELDPKLTANPPFGAGPFKVTVPVEDVPPGTDAGATARAEGTGGVIVKLPVTVASANVPATWTVVEVVTAVVVTVNVAEVAPAATTMLEGSEALELLDVRSTIIPPVGETPFSVTVPVAEVPPVTDAGEILTVNNAGGVTVSVVVTEVDAIAAVTVAETLVAVGLVVIVKFPVIAPAATVTDAGVTALALLELRLTTDPPVGAGPLSVTVPVELLPPTTEVGATETEAGTGGTTVTIALTVEACELAVMVTLVEAATGEVLIVKVPVVPPAGTVILAGTFAAGLLEVNEITAPLDGAGAASVTVPVDIEAPVTEVGASTSPERNGVPIAVRTSAVLPCPEPI